MKLGATLFLRAVLVLFGLTVLAFLLVEPHFEGRNANATVPEIYFGDPFLAYVYVGSIPFFIGLWQAILLLGHSGRNREFSPAALRAVRILKQCARLTVVFVLGALLFILSNESDDRAGGVMMALVVAFAAVVVATGVSTLERSLQKAAEMQSENDLTV